MKRASQVPSLFSGHQSFMSDTWPDGRPPPGLGFRLVALFLEEGRLGLHLQLVSLPRVTLYAEEKSPLALRRENCPRWLFCQTRQGDGRTGDGLA